MRGIRDFCKRKMKFKGGFTIIFDDTELFQDQKGKLTMSEVYFKIDENFEPIIKKALTGEEVKAMNLITTGWTNIVYEVETNEGNYFFRFPRDEFWSRTIVKDSEFARIYLSQN